MKLAIIIGGIVALVAAFWIYAIKTAKTDVELWGREID